MGRLSCKETVGRLALNIRNEGSILPSAEQLVIAVMWSKVEFYGGNIRVIETVTIKETVKFLLWIHNLIATYLLLIHIFTLDPISFFPRFDVAVHS
jgi:hypothetical protein